MTKTTSQRKHAPNNRKQQKSSGVKTEAIVIGLVLTIIGAIIGSSYAKNTLTNYAGFGMLLTGIAIFVLGACATAIASVHSRLIEEAIAGSKFTMPKTLVLSIWSIGLGVILTVIGSLLGSTYAKSTVTNFAGFGMLLAGIGIFVLGIFGTALGTLKIEEKRSGIKFDRPKVVSFDILLMGIGMAFTLIGSILARGYAKETLMNFMGFGMLILGIAVLSMGLSGTVVAALNYRLDIISRRLGECKPKVLFGSVWAMGIGAMLVINGSLIASSYAKSTLMNYAGFAMLLAGTGVFVYGLFETARFSATGFLNSKLTHKPNRGEKCEPDENGTFSERARNAGNKLVKTSAIFNLAGVMTAVCLLFFSLWQLDLIVSGPVWYQNPNGSGWSWPGPGSYAKDYFQCFIWKTTIGQAYDTLFMVIFISFIVLFASAFFWPRGHLKENNVTLKISGRDETNTRRKRAKRRKRGIPPKPTAGNTTTNNEAKLHEENDEDNQSQQ